MERTKLEFYRQQLLAAKNDILTRFFHLNEAEKLGGFQDSISELSMYDNHPADIGTETFERSKDIGLRDLARIQLSKIETALAKIDNETYGKCDICGKNIPEERLNAIPTTAFCYSCQQKVEKESEFKRRPVEETIVMPPFGGILNNRYPNRKSREERLMYDGEDAWQDVARYGTSSDIVHGEGGQPPAQMEELRGIVEDVEAVPYYRDEKGVFYKDFRGKDDEGSPKGPV